MTFDPVTLKSIGVTYLSWLTSIPNMKTVGQWNLKLLGGQAFYIQGPCDLDLWPSDLKINRCLLLIMTNLHAKYEDWIKGILSNWADKLF
jgi:hypothetical protein